MERRAASATVQGVVYSERHWDLLSRARWQSQIYGGRLLSFVRTMRRIRVDVRRRNDGDAGERSDNRGSRGQGIVVGKRQSAGGEVRTTEDTS